MNRLIRLLTILVFVTPGLATTLSLAQQASDPAGHWEGAISLPATELGIRVELTTVGNQWKGNIDIPVQGLRGFDLSEVTFDQSKVSFKMANIPGNPAFEGSVSRDSQIIKGTFSQSGQSYPFQLNRTTPKPTAGATPSKGIPGDGLEGVWQGALQQGLFELRILFKFKKTDEGLVGTMDSLDQNAHDIPLSSVSLDGNAVDASVKAVGGSYTGELSDDGSEIDGKWSQNGTDFSLNLKRIKQAPKPGRPQDPTKPYPYLEEDVTFENEQANIKLSGTLTLPKVNHPVPVVVLVSGSGPQDRDEAIMGHRPFLVIADHLTRHGIGVLRYDDRGHGKSEGKFSTALVRDFTSDALAAVRYLKKRTEIDSAKIGIVGHSEGGLVAPQAATQSDDVAFIVLLAGVGVPMEQLLQRQAADARRVMGIDSESETAQAALQAEIFAAVKAFTSHKATKARIIEILKKSIESYTPEQLEAMGFESSRFESEAERVLSPWFRDLLLIDPRPTLEKVKCPVLALNGEKDIQVAFQENLEGIESAIKRGGNTNITTRSFPDLNHLFQTCTTGAINEYALIEETIAPRVLQTLTQWINSQTHRAP